MLAGGAKWDPWASGICGADTATTNLSGAAETNLLNPLPYPSENLTSTHLFSGLPMYDLPTYWAVGVVMKRLFKPQKALNYF